MLTKQSAKEEISDKGAEQTFSIADKAYLFVFLWNKESPESTWLNVCLNRRKLQEDILTSIQSITSSFLAFLFKIFLSSSSEGDAGPRAYSMF